MWYKALFALLISLVIAQIPEYGTVGTFKCKNTGYHFATSYYETKLDYAHERCKRANCDIIVKWLKKGRNQDYTGYDIGSVSSKPCKTNKEMTAVVEWKKYDDINEIGSNATYNGMFGNTYIIPGIFRICISEMILVIFKIVIV